MQIADIPTKIDIIWASGADTSHVRPIPDTSSDPNAASWTLGFPPNTFVDPGAGGEPPNGEDMNGGLKALSAWINWLNAGGVTFYDSGFSASVGGYPKWATLANAATPGLFWISAVDNNMSDPDTGGANWLVFPPALPSLVSSFNTRTGAVTLTSADVVNALATAALGNIKLAIAPTFSFKGNPTNAPAGPIDMTALQALATLGFSGNSGVAFFPQSGGGVLVRQWGVVGPVADGSITPISFAQSMTTALGLNLTTLNGGGSSDNAMAQEVDGTLTGSGVSVKMQNFAGSAGPNQRFRYEAWGYL